MKEKRDSNTVDADIAELEQDLAEARQLLHDVDKPTPFRVELVGSILLALAVVGVAFVLHRFFPNLDRHDLQFWGFAILTIPVIIGAFWIGIRNKRKANKPSHHTAESRAGARLPASGER